MTADAEIFQLLWLWPAEGSACAVSNAEGGWMFQCDITCTVHSRMHQWCQSLNGFETVTLDLFPKLTPQKSKSVDDQWGWTVLAPCSNLIFPVHGFDPKGTLEKRQSQRVIRLERGTTSKSVYFHLWTFFWNYNLPIRYMHKKLNLGTGTGVFMPQLQR